MSRLQAQRSPVTVESLAFFTGHSVLDLDVSSRPHASLTGYLPHRRLPTQHLAPSRLAQVTPSSPSLLITHHPTRTNKYNPLETNPLTTLTVHIRPRVLIDLYAVCWTETFLVCNVCNVYQLLDKVRAQRNKGAERWRLGGYVIQSAVSSLSLCN